MADFIVCMFKDKIFILRKPVSNYEFAWPIFSCEWMLFSEIMTILHFNDWINRLCFVYDSRFIQKADRCRKILNFLSRLCYHFLVCFYLNSFNHSISKYIAYINVVFIEQSQTLQWMTDPINDIVHICNIFEN